MHSECSERRLRPRIFDTDWLILRQMRTAIGALAKSVVCPGAVAIDIGCGSQPYRGIFEANGAIYKGADFEGAELAIKNGRVDAPDAEADLVVSFQVLEHVADVGAYLHEARRLLKNDGRLILLTHGNWLYHRVGAVLARALALSVNLRGYLEDLVAPEWVTRDNACADVVLARPVGG